MENTKVLLIAQMKRAIELLELIEFKEGYSPYSHSYINAELKNKLHEIRRDSVRLGKGL